MIKTVLVSGSGSNGLLLTGDTNDVLGFKLIDISHLKIQTFIIGGMFGVAYTVNNQLLVWGVFNKEILVVPRQIGLQKQVKSISCGWEHAVIISADDMLYGLGCNKFGQLSSSKESYLSQPTNLSSTKRVLQAHCGFRQTYCLSDANRILGRGQNRYCELTKEPIFESQGWAIMQPEHETIITKMESGKSFFAFLDKNNKLYGCGNNQPAIFKNLPGIVQRLKLCYIDVIDFAAGWKHLVICSINKKIYSYGSNTLGQLGHDQSTDAVVLSQDNIYDIRLTAGTEFTFCSTNLGVFSWGWNQHGNITSEKTQIIRNPIRILDKPANVTTHGAVTFLIQ